MRKLLLALAMLIIAAAHVHALELGTPQATTGFMGAKRTPAKFLPGDVIFLNYNIKDLKVHPKFGTAVYQTKMEIFNSLGKEEFVNVGAIKKIALLGGKSLSNTATAVLPVEQKAGRYQIKITVLDLRSQEKKTLTYDFEVRRAAFGIVQPTTPAVAFAGTDFAVNFGVVGMKRDKKSNLPKVKVSLTVRNELGRAVLPKPATLQVQDLHDPVLNNLTRVDVIRVSFPLFLNRAGRYTFDLEAQDEISGQKQQAQLKLRVLNPADYIGK